MGGTFVASTATPTQTFISFNGGGLRLPEGLLPAIAVGLIGALSGAVDIYGRL